MILYAYRQVLQRVGLNLWGLSQPQPPALSCWPNLPTEGLITTG